MMTEEEAWKAWNKQQREEQETASYSAEQILTWLDGMRAFQFEIWRSNPDLRKDLENQPKK